MIQITYLNWEAMVKVQARWLSSNLMTYHIRIRSWGSKILPPHLRVSVKWPKKKTKKNGKLNKIAQAIDLIYHTMISHWAFMISSFLQSRRSALCSFLLLSHYCAYINTYHMLYSIFYSQLSAKAFYIYWSMYIDLHVLICINKSCGWWAVDWAKPLRVHK